ncbi:SMP-30/gluconolactonase/LRE family protein [Piscinibacter koreensis]|uniref:SMP-30/gluconolactonase/LRE family protein n=1 Tax=Piscinibacter koreensis TaxID=2742824 RepID=A0A7Y6NQY5_9BURK|nr:SMP-30/gluconolactonase/LRE family protein [Schlegelella koreensis]NUZ07722.1 SMP-30/gluconolactonase/LRE family protein [Schlegelella koreensis]
MTVELVVDARARLGECPLWCERTQSLFWTDIQNSQLSRWRSADGSTTRWAMRERLGSFALCEESSHLLLGLASGIALFDVDQAATGDLVAVDAEQPSTRINDGRCDAQGRFVFGMFNHAPEPIGHFYRVDADLNVERLALPRVSVANSLAFSPDGMTLYFTDSPTRTIWRADYHADGRIGTPERFVEVPDGEGHPDGAAVDADGGLWSARWDGACIVRHDADGHETDRIALPVTRPTCVAFGGPNLDRLFITSARGGLSDEALAREPWAGGVLAVDVRRRGRPEHRFRTARRV